MNKDLLLTAYTKLKTINGIEISLSFNDSIDESTIAEMKSYYPDLSEDLISIYKTNDGFSFKWQYEKDSVCLSGQIMLPELTHMLGGSNEEFNEHAFEDYLWNEDDLDQESLELKKRLKLLDYETNGLDISTWIDVGNQQLYFYNGFKLFLLNLQIKNYFETAAENFGLSYWQYLYCNDEEHQKSLTKERVEQVKILLQ